MRRCRTLECPQSGRRGGEIHQGLLNTVDQLAAAKEAGQDVPQIKTRDAPK